MKPPKIAPGSRRSMARGPTDSLQYGHTRSLVVMNARQCGHMRRLSMVNPYCTVPFEPVCYNLKTRMPKSERELRQDIVDIGRLVYQKGWVAANDGNITVRLDDNRILATPTGISKGMMLPDDLIIVDKCGSKIEGLRECTSEILM